MYSFPKMDLENVSLDRDIQEIYSSLLDSEKEETEFNKAYEDAYQKENGKNIDTNKKATRNIRMARKKCKTLRQKRLVSDFIAQQKNRIVEIKPRDQE